MADATAATGATGAIDPSTLSGLLTNWSQSGSQPTWNTAALTPSQGYQVAAMNFASPTTGAVSPSVGVNQSMSSGVTPSTSTTDANGNQIITYSDGSYETITPGGVSTITYPGQTAAATSTAATTTPTTTTAATPVAATPTTTPVAATPVVAAQTPTTTTTPTATTNVTAATPIVAAQTPTTTTPTTTAVAPTTSTPSVSAGTYDLGSGYTMVVNSDGTYSVIASPVTPTTTASAAPTTTTNPVTTTPVAVTPTTAASAAPTTSTTTTAPTTNWSSFAPTITNVNAYNNSATLAGTDASGNPIYTGTVGVGVSNPVGGSMAIEMQPETAYYDANGNFLGTNGSVVTNPYTAPTTTASAAPTTPTTTATPVTTTPTATVASSAPTTTATATPTVAATPAATPTASIAPTTTATTTPTVAATPTGPSTSYQGVTYQPMSNGDIYETMADGTSSTVAPGTGLYTVAEQYMADANNPVAPTTTATTTPTTAVAPASSAVVQGAPAGTTAVKSATNSAGITYTMNSDGSITLTNPSINYTATIPQTNGDYAGINAAYLSALSGE